MMKRVLRQLTGLLVLAVITGCGEWPPSQMHQPADTPADSGQVDSWIARFFEGDVASGRRILDERLATDLDQLLPLVRRMDDFIPFQVHHQSGVGYVRCVRRYYDADSRAMAYQSMFIAEPLPVDVLDSRVRFFDEPVQPLVRAFLERFAGSGEEMEGMAGQFTYSDWPSASDFDVRTDDSHGEWTDAKLLYAAMNGDSVFVRPDGSTAWHVVETDEIVPIAKTFHEFITMYADFRGGHQVFDSWAFRSYLKDRTNR